MVLNITRHPERHRADTGLALCLQMSSCSRLLLPLLLSGSDALRASPTTMRSRGTSMTETTAVKISIEEAVSLFGRHADTQHVFTEPIRTAASGFEFSSNTAIKPKWLIAYTSRAEPCGEDVSLPTYHTRWSSLLFADSASTCTCP